MKNEKTKSTINRRDFLRNTSFLTAGGILAGSGIDAFTAETSLPQSRSGKSYGLQIYSLWGFALPNDGGLADDMKKVYDMGYSYLELAGYNQQTGNIGQVPMADVKKAASDAGLEIRCSHLNPTARGPYTRENRAEIAEFWKKAAEDHAKIDVKMLVQPGQPSTRNIPETRFVCEVFNEVGQICKNAGLSWGYHNHSNEFAWISPDSEAYVFAQRAPGGRGGGGTTADAAGGTQQQPQWVLIQDQFITNTDPSLVFFELDVYWTVMGLQDPLDWMRRYPNRIQVLHIKDRLVLGQSGLMNFEQIFRQAYANNVHSFFVELERMPAGTTQFDGVKGCADYLNTASFVK